MLVYCPDNSPRYTALKKTIYASLPEEDKEKIIFSSVLKVELLTGKYGLVIDASGLDKNNMNRTVAHDLKYIQLNEIPKVVCIYNNMNALVDVLNLYSSHTNK